MSSSAKLGVGPGGTSAAVPLVSAGAGVSGCGEAGSDGGAGVEGSGGEIGQDGEKAPVALPGLMKNRLSNSNASNLCTS